MTFAEMLKQLYDISAALLDPGAVDSDGRFDDLLVAQGHIEKAIAILKDARGAVNNQL